MKARESGMPDEGYWNTFFDAACLVGKMFGNSICPGSVVEFGSGYGTFTLPAARLTTGTVTALDIEPELITRLRQKALDHSIHNVDARLRDFVADGSGLAPQTQAHAMIYNLLHVEAPVALLAEAHRVLQPGGHLSVIHWRSDIPTPRGPTLSIRPSPQQCKAWMAEAGFRLLQDVDLAPCCHYHFGIIALR
jgi:ubiquinone/menaquinone biosynthesis C-methylase UbiE